MLENIVLAICYIIGIGALVWVLGEASELGHGERRQKPRDPLDIDTEFL